MPKVTTQIVFALIATLALSSCANTIRGVGRDVSNTAHATKNAVKDATN